MLIAGDVVDVDVEMEGCWMLTSLSASAGSGSLIEVVVALEFGLGRHASTPNRTIIFMLHISYSVNVFNERIIFKEWKAMATYIGDGPLMARGKTVLRGAGHCGHKAMPKRAVRVDFTFGALPAA
jgi:hypothetical protein